jgi:hypothetical protein
LIGLYQHFWIAAAGESACYRGMRFGGIAAMLLGSVCALWVTACYVMRFTYLRELTLTYPDSSPLARKAVHALATDFSLPSLVVCAALMTAGIALFRIGRRPKNGTP